MVEMGDSVGGNKSSCQNFYKKNTYGPWQLGNHILFLLVF
jgi:hypothetical protein